MTTAAVQARAEAARAEQAAKARMDRYAKDQQGLKNWTKDALAAHKRAIVLALEFEEAQGEITLPSDKKLRAELECAGAKFERSPEAMWRVLRNRYRESDAALDAWAEEFVSEYADDLRQANERRQLGDMDDDEEPEDEAASTDTDADPKASFAAAAKEAAVEAIKKFNRLEEEVLKAIQKAIRNHPEIGDTSGPPGKGDGMQAHGRWRVTKYGVFAPGVGLWEWDRISKTLLKPLAHSSLHPGDTEPRVHLIRATFDGERQIEREIEIERWKINTRGPGAAIKALTHFNVYVVRNEYARAEMIHFLNRKPTKLKIARTKTTGWFKIDGDYYCFVLPLAPPDLAPIMPKRNPPLARKKSKAKAKPKIEVRLDTRLGEVSRQYGLNVSGTVEEWQQIARRLDGCSNVALAAATAFAGPLLLFAGEQMGGFHIWCRSTFGKSVAGALGESIWGRPSTTLGEVEPFGAKWATASDVGLVAMAEKRTDLGLFLDELGSAKGAKQKLMEAIYLLSGGTPKLRADSQGNLREQRSFRVMVFSTGEHPLRDFLAKMDDTEGRAKRLVDVPALVRGKGLEGSALETVPHEELESFCPPIYAELGRVHGAVGQAWLRYLVDLGEVRIKERLDRYRQEWLSLPEIAELLGRDPQKDSVIRRFALLAAVLRMAIEAGLWPWSIENSDRGIVACCLRWAADTGMPIVTMEMKAEEQELRARTVAWRAADRFLILNKRPGKGNGIFEPVPEHAIRYEDPMAFKQAGTLSGFIKMDGPESRILVYADEFRRLTEGLDHDGLVAHLQRAGWLTIKKEKVKGRPDTYYVLAEAFLRAPRQNPQNRRTVEP